MNLIRITLLLAILSALSIASLGCVDRATETQIDGACQNLSKIQPSQGDDAGERLNKCKQDLANEKVSAAVAQCRAEATSVDAFWNRCR